MIQKQKIKGVIFDWNGTLSNDIPRVFNVTMKTVAKTGGIPIRSYQEYRRRVHNPWYPFYLEMGCRASMEEITKWFTYYSAHSKVPISLFPDAKNLVNYLKTKNIKVGVISSHITKHLKREARQYGILKLIDFIEGDLHTKSHHIRLFLKRFGFKPHEVIYIGDMVNDVREGKRCKVITAAYLKGADTKTKLKKEKPNFFLPRLSLLRKFV